MSPRAVLTVTLSPSAALIASAVPADSRTTGVRAVPARCGSPSWSRPSSSSIRQPDNTASPAPGVGAAAAATVGVALGVPSHAPSATNSACAASTVGNPRSMPTSSARVSSTRRSGVAAGGSAAANERGRPSQLTYVPDFSAAGAIGKTTSARSVTALCRSSRLTTNPAASNAASTAAGSAKSSGSMPPTSSAPSVPSAAAASIASASRPGVEGNSSTFQPCSICARAVSSLSGRPPGSNPGNAPASSAPRSPARRGTHASLAPVASASLAAADSPPGTAPSRSPTMMIGAGLRKLGEQLTARSPPKAAASAPGAVSISVPCSFFSPLVANGATAWTASPCLRAALRSRRYTIGDSSSGSKPASRTTDADSRSA